jgi:hypothetical protein
MRDKESVNWGTGREEGVGCYLINCLLLCLMIGATSACTLMRPEALAKPSPVEDKTATPLVVPPTLPAPSITLTPFATETSTHVPALTPSPTLTRQAITRTPATPTQLPKPYLIAIQDWEMVQAVSPTQCSSCGSGMTVVQAPRDLPIAVVQVYIKGEAGATSRLTTDLVYTSPDSLTCALEEGEQFCGLLFGQVVAGRITLSAEYIGGGQHQLEYLITFQDWAKYPQ